MKESKNEDFQPFLCAPEQVVGEVMYTTVSNPYCLFESIPTHSKNRWVIMTPG